MVEGITVVMFGMNDVGGNGRSCFGIEVGADASCMYTLTVYSDKFILILLSKINKSDDCMYITAYCYVWSRGQWDGQASELGIGPLP